MTNNPNGKVCPKCSSQMTGAILIKCKDCDKKLGYLPPTSIYFGSDMRCTDCALKEFGI